MNRLATLALVLALATGCPGRPPDYFPLEAGRNWDYRVSVSIKGQQQVQRLLLGSVATKTVDGTVYYPRRMLVGKLDYHARTADGVVFVRMLARC